MEGLIGTASCARKFVYAMLSCPSFLMRHTGWTSQTRPKSKEPFAGFRINNAPTPSQESPSSYHAKHPFLCMTLMFLLTVLTRSSTVDGVMHTDLLIPVYINLRVLRVYSRKRPIK